MTHTCTTNSESESNPISRCCGIEADDNTPLTVCPRCGKLTGWECGDCGITEWAHSDLYTIDLAHDMGERDLTSPFDWRK
jgi:hypothetical protein